MPINVRSRAAAAAVILCTIAYGTVFYVHPESTLNCIQDCLDSCCSTGDTVVVGAGTYYENIFWPDCQGIKLIGEYGRDTTIIDGDSAGSVITCATGLDATTVISGFTITNGYAEAGGGIRCDLSSPTIFHCAILDNWAIANPGYGGGICCRRSSPILVDDTIANNSAGNINPGGAGFGGGIACLDSSVPVVYRNTITDNGAGGPGGAGGGVYCDGHSDARIVRNTIASNGLFGSGSGIHCSSSDCVIDSNVIRENTVLGAGGGIGVADCSPIITNNLITQNVGMWLTVGSRGAGIAVSRSTARISGNTITLNQLQTEGAGGGIYCAEASPTIDSCKIGNNEGEGVYCADGAEPEIHFNDITGNEGLAVLNMSSTVVVDAEYNWWGDSTGPFHPDSNPSGQGDTVSDYVDFEPWLDAPVGIVGGPREKARQRVLPPTIVRGSLPLSGGAEAELLDISGRRVMSLQPGQNDIRHVAPGVYFVKTVGSLKTRRVVIAR
jgi:hypothetical protein